MTKGQMPETKRQAATAERRRHIVLSAAACFIEQGFHQTSVRDIAKKANISLGNLYNHFDSKAALIAEIASLEAAELEGIEGDLENTAAPDKAIERFTGSYFDYMAQPENAVLAFEIGAEAFRNPEIARGYVQNRKRLAAKLKNLLRAGADHGLFALGDAPGELADLLLDLIEGAALRTAFDNRGAQKRARKSLIVMVKKTICVQI